jgi:hypothetical protein
MEQGALFVPTAQGEQAVGTIQARLLHRADDPETSRLAAARISNSKAGNLAWAE